MGRHGLVLRGALAFAGVAACLWAAATTGAELSDTVRRIKPSIVGVGTVQLLRRPPGRFVGTGFVVADGRHAVTNAHVIPKKMDRAGKEQLAILIPRDGKGETRKAEVIGTDRKHDLALLRFEGKPLPAMALADSRKVREGELYAFTGFPLGMVLGMRPVTHRGIVAAITPIVLPQNTGRALDPQMIRRMLSPYTVFQLDAVAYPGNSGSPLYDPDTGRVVGVINSVFVKESKEAAIERPSGISYAIPARYVSAMLKKAGVAER